MSDEATTHESEEEATQKGTDWADEAEAALEGVGVALREAWEASREARLSALESAKKAAQQLGEAIDHGVTAAREKWEAPGGTPPEATSGDAADEAEDADHHGRAPLMGPDDGRTDQH